MFIMSDIHLILPFVTDLINFQNVESDFNRFTRTTSWGLLPEKFGRGV